MVETIAFTEPKVKAIKPPASGRAGLVQRQQTARASAGRVQQRQQGLLSRQADDRPGGRHQQADAI